MLVDSIVVHHRVDILVYPRQVWSQLQMPSEGMQGNYRPGPSIPLLQLHMVFLPETSHRSLLRNN
jgi:hypothetical protein